MALATKPKASTAADARPKDNWDKLDIIGKALIPVAVALSVLWWNSERTSRDTAAQMITIATSILTATPDTATPNALRDWAIEVLQSPENPPKLTDEAAAALSKETLPSWLSMSADLEKLLGPNRKLTWDAFPEVPNEPNAAPSAP